MPMRPYSSKLSSTVRAPLPRLDLGRRGDPGTESRRASVIFSPKRQSWVRNYKDMARSLPEHYGRCGSTEWIEKLLQYLQNYQADIQMEDLNKWMGKYPWIRQEIVGAPSADAFRPPPAMNDSAQDRRPAVTAVIVGSPQNPPTASTGGNGGNQQIPGETPKKELLKRYDAIRDQIIKLEEMTENLPEFRAAIPAFNFLARVIGRNYRHVVGGNKRREEVLHEDLAREGIPHVQKGFKRERLQVPKGSGSDSECELVFGNEN